MAQVYEIHPDRKVWGNLNLIEATHAQKLPGIRCPNCGTWAMTGIIYPSIDVSLLNVELLPVSISPIPIDFFNDLACGITAAIGAERVVGPGTELGPLHGKAKGSFGDFAWVNPWTPLLRESVWLALKEAGIELQGVRAELNFEKPEHEPLIELEVHPRAMLTSELVPKKCSVCKRLPINKPDNIIIAAASFDSSIPLQRIAELPSILVVNECFAKYIQQRNLRDVLLTPIETR